VSGGIVSRSKGCPRIRFSGNARSYASYTERGYDNDPLPVAMLHDAEVSIEQLTLIALQYALGGPENLRCELGSRRLAEQGIFEDWG
jgi:hypothetical protein